MRVITFLRFVVMFLYILSLPLLMQAQTPNDSLPAAPTAIHVADHKYDGGGVLDISWTKSADDSDGVIGYRIYLMAEDPPSILIDSVLPGIDSYRDMTVQNGVPYRYQVAAVTAVGEARSELSLRATADWELFDFAKLNIFIIGLLVCGAVIGFILSARSGRKLYIRKISGLDALDEAVGRATEMGRPIVFIAGIRDMDDVQTIAGITILGRVARVVADYDSKIRMPVSRSLVMTSARETIKQAYIAAGRPDAYSDDMVQYITDEQFGFVAAVNGIMVREKPATCLYLGTFFAESLILAETGNSIGAIQIAGTAMPAQLPFFVAACDYTLIGEELFAASAYLSNDPKQLGSLKGADVAKFVAMAAIVLGTLSVTIASAWQVPAMRWLSDLLLRIFSNR